MSRTDFEEQGSMGVGYELPERATRVGFSGRRDRFVDYHNLYHVESGVFGTPPLTPATSGTDVPGSGNP
jgi:hypothetical protein